jgi:hypothetical protein
MYLHSQKGHLHLLSKSAVQNVSSEKMFSFDYRRIFIGQYFNKLYRKNKIWQQLFESITNLMVLGSF